MANLVGGSVVWNLDADTSKFEAGLNKAKDSASSFGNKVNALDFKGISSGASSAFNGVANSIAGAAIKLAAFTVGAGGLGTIFVKSAADLQQTSKSFEVLTGNVTIANKLFAQLAQYANTTPFEFPDIAKAGQILLGFGIQSDKVFGNIKTLGDIAAATGADFTSLALVFGQVNATGKLMGQDSLQLINNKIPITSLLAKKLGVSVQEVKARMEDGKISADLFNEALLDATKKGGFAFQGTTILAESFNGRLSTLKDTVLEFGRNLLGVKVDPKLGLVIEKDGIFDKISLALPKITEGLKEMTPAIKGAFDFLMNHGNEVVAIIGSLAAVFVVAKVAAFGFWLATLPISLPVLAIVAAVIALTGVFTYLQIRFDILGKAMDIFLAVGDAVAKGFIDLIFAMGAGINKFLNGIVSAWNSIGNATTNAWNSIGNSISNGMNTAKNAVYSIINSIWSFLTGTWNNIYSFFAGMAGRIVDAITQPFRDAKNAIDNIANQIRNAANNINPFVRHSPSLVDNVTRGIGIIKDEYASLKDISVPSISGLIPMPDFSTTAPMNVTGDYGVTDSRSGSGQPINVYIDKVNDQQDIQAIGRELAFRTSLSK